MDDYLVWLLILLVVGVVISNIMVLKYTTKFKGPSTKSSSKDDSDNSDSRD